LDVQSPFFLIYLPWWNHFADSMTDRRPGRLESTDKDKQFSCLDG
jgi:hypothetical protein